MPDTITPSDHDKLTTLVETVSNMKESQDKFHIEMRDSLKDLKENYAERLNIVEKGLQSIDKVFIAKNEQDRRDAILSTRVAKLETSRIRLNVLISIATGLIGILVVLEFFSLLKIVI